MINERNLETAVGCNNLAGNKTRYYSNEFRKKRDKIQDCKDFQPCRKFIVEELAIQLIVETKRVKAAELKTKLGFNQINPIMSKEGSVGLRLKKAFSGEKIKRRFFCFKLFDWFLFSKIQTRRRNWWIRINPDKKYFSTYDGFGEIYKFFDEFKKKKEKDKELLIDRISKRLVDLKFENHNSI